MQIQTFCWMPLRRGAIIISTACFVMAVLNVISAAIPPDNDKTLVISRSVHAVLGVIYAAAGALLALAIYQGSVALVRLWLALFAVLALASLLAHDLARYDWVTLETDSTAAVVTGIGLFNVVLDVVFLMAVYALLLEMQRQKEDDVAAASRPRSRPRATPGAPSVAPALPLRDIVPPARAPAPAPAILNGAATRNAGPEDRHPGGHIGNQHLGPYDGGNDRIGGDTIYNNHVTNGDYPPTDRNYQNGDCSETNSFNGSFLHPKRVNRNDPLWNTNNRDHAELNERIGNGDYRGRGDGYENADVNYDGAIRDEVEDNGVHGFVNNAYNGPTEVKSNKTILGKMKGKNQEQARDWMEI